MKKFFLFSLLFVFGLLIFLSYPQVSLAAAPVVTTVAPSVGQTNATLRGDVTAGVAVGRGFEFGTASETYTCTTSEFHATDFGTGAFTHPTSTIDQTRLV